MMKLRHLALAASASILAACASTTPFQPASKPGGFDGYSQTMIENDRARVSFGGNSLTDRETVETYLLFRTAEIAKERGFDYFVLDERDVEADTRLRSTGSRFGPAGFGAGFGAYDPYFGYSFYRPRFGWGRAFPYSYYNRYNAFGPRGFGFRSGFRGGYGGFNDFDVREITKYRATAEASFGRGPTPDARNAFNANEVIENLGPQIKYPEDEG